MRKNIFLFLFFIILFNLSTQDVYQNYVQVYGEGPIGQHLIGFKSITYSKEEAVEFAKDEIMEFLSALVYGYTFNYKVENKINNRKGYFDLNLIANLKKLDKAIILRQLEEGNISIRIQGLYRLSEDQKKYIRGFQSSIAKMSVGEAKESIVNSWENRIIIYKNALKNAVFNEAKKRYKSRPIFLKGRILLINSPKFYIASGEWLVRVKVHVIINEVKFPDVY